MTEPSDSFPQELLSQLRRLEQLLRVGFAVQIDEALQGLGLDELDRAILAASDSWTPSGSLNADVAEVSGKTPRTIRRRFADLQEAGLLESRGAGRSLEYRAVGMGVLSS